MEFTETGTLKKWSVHGVDIIPHIYETASGKSRGGAFLCLPNFEALPAPFEIKHGEYRKELCKTELPQQKIIASKHTPGWGKLSTSVMWEETLSGEVSILTTCVVLKALSDTVHLRPGFHPYFTIAKPFSIVIGDTTIDETSLPYDQLYALPVHSDSPAARLNTNVATVLLSCSVAGWPSNSTPSYSFCVWSDNKDEYVCIEPVIGGTHNDEGLPSPFILEKNTELTLVFTIEVKKTENS